MPRPVFVIGLVDCRHRGCFSRGRFRDPILFYIRAELIRTKQRNGSVQGGIGVYVRTGHHASCITRSFVRTIETVIDSHLPCLQDRHIPTLGHRVTEEGSRLLICRTTAAKRITSAQAEIQQSGSWKFRICLKLNYVQTRNTRHTPGKA